MEWTGFSVFLLHFHVTKVTWTFVYPYIRQERLKFELTNHSKFTGKELKLGNFSHWRWQ